MNLYPVLSQWMILCYKLCWLMYCNQGLVPYYILAYLFWSVAMSFVLFFFIILYLAIDIL